MLLIEQIFLVGIDEKSKKIFLNREDFLFYGAIMMDLLLLDKISIEKDLDPDRKSTTTSLKIKILNTDSTDNTVLDKMLNFLEINSGKDTLTEILVQFTKRSNFSDFRKVIISKLESLGFIKYLGKKRLQRRYQITEPALKAKILNEIDAVLFDNQEPTKELLFLLSLLRIQYNIRRLIPKKLIRIAEERLYNLLFNELIGLVIQGVIDDMNASFNAKYYPSEERGSGRSTWPRYLCCGSNSKLDLNLRS